VYNSFALEDAGSKVTLMTGVVELRNPNTRMKMMGNRKLKITAEGLLKIDFKLAFAMAQCVLFLQAEGHQPGNGQQHRCLQINALT
jgi:hypothetical protein